MEEVKVIREFLNYGDSGIKIFGSRLRNGDIILDNFKGEVGVW